MKTTKQTKHRVDPFFSFTLVPLTTTTATGLIITTKAHRPTVVRRPPRITCCCCYRASHRPIVGSKKDCLRVKKAHGLDCLPTAVCPKFLWSGFRLISRSGFCGQPDFAVVVVNLFISEDNLWFS